MEIRIKKSGNGIHPYATVCSTDIKSEDLEFLNAVVSLATNFTEDAIDKS